MKKSSKLTGKKKAGIIVLAVLMVLCLAVSGTSVYNVAKRDYRSKGRASYLQDLETKEKAENAKNVIIILLDDMGYGDLSCTGSEAISTPNIDALADNGILFTNYYSPNPICSASRAGMLTGRYPLRTLTAGAYMDTETVSGHLSSFWQGMLGTYVYFNQGLPTDEILLPEVLKASGYSTGLVGKWHLGVKKKERPNNRGFDYFYGALYSDDMKPYRVYENDKVIHKSMQDQSNLTKELTEKSVDFIEENKDQPFFLYYASPFPHYPAACSDEWAGSSKGGTFGDCMQEVDWSVGEIVSTLRKENLLEDTLILFTSDNGPWYEGSTGGQRGRKANKFNGGTHLPLIASMKGTLPEGVTNDSLISGLDIFPTILDMNGIAMPTDREFDGSSVYQAMLTNGKTARNTIYINDDKDSFAIIKDNFKYMEKAASENSHYWNLKQGPFLFDLSTDPDEAYDVTSLYPDKAKELESELNTFKKSLKKNIRGWKTK